MPSSQLHLNQERNSSKNEFLMQQHQQADLEEPLIMNGDHQHDGLAPIRDEDLEVDPSPGRRRRRTRRHILQAIFLLLGVGVLVPWNAFISAKQYFQSRLCVHDAQTDTYSPSISNIESVFAMLYNLSSVLSLGLVITIQAMRDQQVAEEHTVTAPTSAAAASEEEQQITILEGQIVDDDLGLHQQSSSGSTGHNSSHTFWLVMAPLTLYLASFLGQSVMVFVVHTPIFEQFTFLSLTVCGMSCVIAQSGIVATAGLFDSDLAMNPYLVGQSVGGVAVSLANFLSAFLEDPNDFRNTFCNDGEDELQSGNFLWRALVSEEQQQSSTCAPYQRIDWAAFFYFFMGSLLLLACLFGYHYVDRFQKSEHRDLYETVHSIGEDSINGSQQNGLEMHESATREAEEEVVSDGLVHTKHPVYGEAVATDEEPDGLLHSGTINDLSVNETAAVWAHVKKPAIAIFLTFFVTLGLFPGWTSELRSVRQCRTHFRLANDLYVPFMFLFFNLGDLTGRLLSARLPTMQIRDLSTKLVAAACLRFLFFPLLFLCTGGSNPDRLQIHSDLYSEVIQFAFAISNGFVLSTAFVHAPSLVPHTTDMQERCSEILNFSVAFGLLCGSLFSFPVAQLVNR